ncbi:sirohydrochlorin chelatase [Calycomorphotria hydatis]|uniref:Sirohydrochlorin ferrochelatase n=1 Tax=Calycomorphotria hydatis TaxID=2528027 RepID=A0A517TD55_9PLAN|nr:CbiX/SirB N-terminal domain-containing protein [Calycomorphotria hydatis]QDT66299.1 Sirohydrochlorin ferrochelatase [Calycomorphotria hydatis]
MQTAALIIAHGSRRQEANDDLVKLAHMVRERGVVPIVEIAYLELAEPDIPTGAATCVARGADVVLMSPFFLSMGRHVAGDLEKFRAEFSAEYPEVEFKVCPPLGLDERVVDVLVKRMGEG